eukprot:364793-Chlamydomonas_euryale.AAC.10
MGSERPPNTVLVACRDAGRAAALLESLRALDTGGALTFEPAAPAAAADAAATAVPVAAYSAFDPCMYLSLLWSERLGHTLLAARELGSTQQASSGPHRCGVWAGWKGRASGWGTQVRGVGTLEGQSKRLGHTLLAASELGSRYASIRAIPSGCMEDKTFPSGSSPLLQPPAL